MLEFLLVGTSLLTSWKLFLHKLDVKMTEKKINNNNQKTRNDSTKISRIHKSFKSCLLDPLVSIIIKHAGIYRAFNSGGGLNELDNFI